MNIVFVIDQYNDLNNGTSATAQRTAKELEKLGHKVDVLASGTVNNAGTVKKMHIPFFQNLIEAQGFALAKRPDEKVYEEAFKDADLIHFFLASPFCVKGMHVAEKMGKARLAAFHVQPQNVTYSIGLGKSKWANNLVYKLFYKYFYSHFKYIHCPSEMIKEQLRIHNYPQKLVVISNGVNEYFKPLDIKKPKSLDPYFVLLMVGRLSAEKRQDLLVEASKYSKYKDKLKIIFAGAGPKDKKLRRLAEDLENEAIFGFYNEEQLRKIYNISDLYIHCANAEIEGISCMEAIACGAVPLISDSKFSASKNFALTDKSTFKANDPKDLAKHIDFWLDHPEERAKYSKLYAEEGERLHISNQIKDMESLYFKVLDAYK